MRYLAPVILLAAVYAASTGAQTIADTETLIKGITDPSADVRATAWKSAGPLGAKAVAPLGPYLASDTPGVAKAARAALAEIVMRAGRPGAEQEAAAVAAEFAKLLDPSIPSDARREVMHLLSLIATDAEVPAIVTFLSDPTLAEDARIALDRIPTDAAAKALVDALPAAPPELRARIVDSLGHKNAQSAIPALLELARKDDSRVSWACLDALARLGMPPDRVFPRSPTFSPEENSLYTQAFLRAGEALARRGDSKSAERIFAAVAAFSQEPQHVCAALTALSDLGSEKAEDHALAHLSDPGARIVATQVLIESKAAHLDRRLEKAYKLTNPAKRALILRVLAARRAPNLAPLLESAMADASAEVRVTAAELSGRQPAKEDVFEVMASGMPWNKDHAVETCLALAETTRQAGDAATAREMFETVLQGDFAKPCKATALEGVERLASQESLPLVKQFMDDPELDLSAERAYVAISAANTDTELAKKLLFEVVDKSQFHEVAAMAIDHLRKLGADTTLIPKRRGFITEWSVLGPFPNPDNSAFGKSFFPERDAQARKPVHWEGQRYEWKDARTDAVPATIDLRSLLQPNENQAAYACATLNATEASPVVFLIGSDDGCEFWLNGQKLHQNGDARTLRVDQDRVSAALKPGENTVLIKVLQGASDWQFCVRVTHPDGTPVNFAVEPHVTSP